MELGEPDASGRRRPVPVKGSEYIIEGGHGDHLHREQSEPRWFRRLPPRSTSRSGGTIVADEETMATSKAGVFAAGDIVSGAATVISAMGQGKKAARSIHKYITGGEPPDLDPAPSPAPSGE